MEKLVKPEICIDDDEGRKFKDYKSQPHRISQRINTTYRQKPSQQPVFTENLDLKNYVQPIYGSADYCDFQNATNIVKELQSDLAEYEKYSTFSVDKMIASKVKEAIIESINPTQQPTSELLMRPACVQQNLERDQK